LPICDLQFWGQENEKLKESIQIFKQKQTQLREAVESYETSTLGLEKQNAELAAKLAAVQLKAVEAQYTNPSTEAASPPLEFAKTLHGYNVAEIVEKLASVTSMNKDLSLQLQSGNSERERLSGLISSHIIEIAKLEAKLEAIEKENQERDEAPDQSITILTLKTQIADLETKLDACQTEKSFLEADRNSTLKAIHLIKEQQASEAKVRLKIPRGKNCSGFRLLCLWWSKVAAKKKKIIVPWKYKRRTFL